jgi:hypothetical protein
MKNLRNNFALCLVPSTGTPGEGEGGGFHQRASVGPTIYSLRTPSPTLPRITGGGGRKGTERHRSGIIFITALGIIVILTGLALVFAQQMRTEALASANRRSQAEADAIETGAENFVLAQVEAYQPDAMTITTVPADAIRSAPAISGS